MGEIILHDYGFSLIPKAAEKDFIQLMNNWYEFITEDEKTPYIKNYMLDHDREVADVFSEFFYEVCIYTYASGADDVEFPKEQFPIDSQKFLDCRLGEEQAYYDAQSSLEFSFFNDMRKYLNTNRMFFTDSYSWHDTWGDPKPKYFNVPIREVW